MGDEVRLRTALEQLEHLNAVLSGIRNVNQLITRERDPRKLIQEACELLVESRGFEACSILVEGRGRGRMAALEGGGQEWGRLREALVGGEPPECMRSALDGTRVVVRRCTEAPECGGCAVTGGLEYRGDVVVAPLGIGDGVLGCMFVALPERMSADEQEQGLLREAAGDVTFALRSIETEREKRDAQTKARESQRMLETLMNNLSGMVYRCRNDESWTMEFLSEGCRELTGYGVDDLMGNARVAYADLIHPDDREKVWRTVQQAVAERRAFVMRYRILDAGGRVRWVWEKGVSVVTGQGGVEYLEGFITDVTALVEATEELSLAEQRFKTLFDSMGEGVAVHEMVRDEGGHAMDYRVTDVNPAFSVHTGISAEEARGELASVLYGTREPPFLDVYSRVAASQQAESFDTFFEPMDRHFNISVFSPAPDSFATVFTDVTEQKKAQEVLRESERRARLMYDLLPVATLVWRHRKGAFYLSDYNEAALSLTRGEIQGWMGRRVGELRDRLGDIEDDLTQCLGGHDALSAEMTASFGGRDEPRQCILTHGYIPPDMVITHVEDVTAQRRIEEQMRAAQKMEAVGRLAGGVAHDFNNLLTVINSYADLLLGEMGPDDAKRQDVREIRSAGDKAAALTQQLLAFSRRQVLEPEVMNLNRVVEEMARMLERVLGEDIDLRFELDAELDDVKADRGQVEQVLMNLVVNARDAMPDGGKLTIETHNVVLDEGYAQRHAEVEPGSYVMLAVSDSGEGMDEETRENIFEPFFTTKQAGKGTGLGLSTVYGIVKQSGGSIWVYSEPGRGTTFKVYLPIDVEGVVETASAPRREREPGGSETILVAEDDDAVRTLIVRILRKAGYEVLEARSGEQALSACRGAGGEVHLIITDVVMTGMSGKETAGRLERMFPGIDVLYMSGYTDNAIVHHGVLVPGTSFLAKPFTSADLLRKVRDVLDAGEG
jgi:PAS domain S-box-containing protein